MDPDAKDDAYPLTPFLDFASREDVGEFFPGDWRCRGCGRTNHFHRLFCRHCGGER